MTIAVSVEEGRRQEAEGRRQPIGSLKIVDLEEA